MGIFLGMPCMMTLMFTHLVRLLLGSIHLYASIPSSVWVAMLRPLLAHMLTFLMLSLMRLLMRWFLGTLPLLLLPLSARAAKLLLYAAICPNLWVATLRPSLAHLFFLSASAAFPTSLSLMRVLALHRPPYFLAPPVLPRTRFALATKSFLLSRIQADKCIRLPLLSAQSLIAAPSLAIVSALGPLRTVVLRSLVLA